MSKRLVTSGDLSAGNSRQTNDDAIADRQQKEVEEVVLNAREPTASRQGQGTVWDPVRDGPSMRYSR